MSGRLDVAAPGITAALERLLGRVKPVMVATAVLAANCTGDNRP
jgi:hypothetical protein